MARIPDEQIERLKQEVALQRLAEGMGITLTRHGADLIGLCPFHDDKEPSLVVSPIHNLWHCLGACQCGGSVIDWVMKAEGVSFRHAVELLQADYQPLVAGSGPAKHSTVRKLPTTLESSAEDARLLGQVVDYYHETLKQSPEALAYLEKRGFSIERNHRPFQAGLCQPHLRLPVAGEDPQRRRGDSRRIRGPSNNTVQASSRRIRGTVYLIPGTFGNARQFHKTAIMAAVSWYRDSTFCKLETACRTAKNSGDSLLNPRN